MEINLTRCALCGKEGELRESHIIPKFVFRRLAKTAVGKLRSGTNPNVPVQDGEKHKLLCADCEGLFSTFEAEFARNIFYPFQDSSQKQFQYNEWLQKFVISVSWRSLYLDLIDFVRNQIGNIDSITNLVECERIMRDYLLDIRSDVGRIENHIFFFDDIDNASEEFTKLNPHMNILRSATSYTTIIESTQAHYTFTNLSGILLFTLYGRKIDEVWENTQVLCSGTISAQAQIVRSHCPDELLQALEEANRIRSSVSDKQQEKIDHRYHAVTCDASRYPIFELAAKDKILKTKE